MKYFKKIMFYFLAFSLVFSLYVPLINASERSFDDIYSDYLNSSKWEKDAEELLVELRSEADPLTGYDLWRSLWDDNIGSDQRVANSIKLIDELFPESDTRRWNDIKGFWYPGIVPKTLAAIDAVYVASLELLQMDRKGSAWLARNFVNDLSRSSRAKLYFMKTAPAEYLTIINMLKDKEMDPVIGNWTDPEVKGNLPLAVPVRGYIGNNRALSEDYIFLSGSGQIVNVGNYAWDRIKGRIYRVIDRERDGGSHIIYFPIG